MALIVADRVRENSTTTGTGTLTLSGSPLGYQTFSSAVGNGNTTYYAISNPGVNEWEVGIGTVGAGTLARNTVLASSTGTALVAFTAGNKDVFCTYPAEVSVFAGNTQTLTNKTISGANNTLSNIGNSSLSNSSLTVGSTNIALGGTATTLAGLTSVSATTFTGALSGNANTATTATNIAGGAASQIPYQSAAGTTTFIANGTAGQVLKSNGASAPSWANTSDLGVTSFAGGTTGLTPAAATTGAVTLAGTLAIANGGTGQTTRQNAMDALAGATTSGYYLRGNGTDVVMSAIQAADVPTLNQNTTGTASNVTGTVAVANGGTGATTLTGVLKGNGTSAFTAATAGTDYAKPNTASTWSASQRGTQTTDNDLSFDMNVTNNFICTPSGSGTLTFTNITAGQSGYVLLINTGGHAITAAATTKVGDSFLSTVSAAGTYLISYMSTGSAVYCTTSGALS